MRWNSDKIKNYKVIYCLFIALFLGNTVNLEAQNEADSLLEQSSTTNTDRTELLKLLKKLSGDKNIKVKAAVASNTLTPASTLTSLSKNKNVQVKSAAASNSNTPAKEIKTLAGSKDTIIQKAVASNIQCTSEYLVKLLSTNNMDIDYTVIANPNIPESYFETIISNTDKDNVLLAALAANPACPPSSLLELAEIDNLIYLPIVLANPGAPLSSLIPHVINPFEAEDSAAGISLLLNSKVSPELKRQLTDYIGYEVMNSIASDMMTPTEILRELANLKNAKIRKSVASNLSTPIDVLRDLSEDINREVRVKVATNPSNSLGLLRELAQDESKEVRMAVTLNDITTDEMIESMYNEIADLLVLKGVMRDYMPDSIVLKLISDPRTEVRFGLALFKDASPIVLNLLSDDPDDKVREAVAVHKNINKETLQKLSKDPYVNVRNGVAINTVTPLQTLIDIAARPDNDPYLLADIIFNPNASQELVDNIVKNKDNELYDVLEAHWKTLASKPETTDEVIMRMYKLLPNAIVERNQIIRTNYVAPNDVLGVMNDTIVPDLSLETILYNLKPLDFSVTAFNYFSNYFFIRTLDEGVMLSDMQISLLKKMKEDNFYLDKLVLANRAETPNDLLLVLYQMGDSWIKHLVAANASIEPTFFESLKFETDELVLCGIAQNTLMSVNDLNNFMKTNKGDLVKIGAATKQ